MTSAARPHASPSLLPDEDSRFPLATPSPEEAGTLRRAADQHLLSALAASVSVPGELAAVRGALDELRRETREGLQGLGASASRTEALLGQLVEQGRQANQLRAEELEEARETRRAREEASRWWRGLLTPQVALYVVLILATLAGVGHLIPLPAPTTSRP